MAKGKYLFAKEDGTLFFKLEGILKYTESLSFDAFIDSLIQKKDFNEAVFDLTEVLYVDSTNLGIIAKLGDYLLETYGKRTTLISTNDDVNEILRSVGFDEVFILIDDPSERIDQVEEIPNTEQNTDKDTGNMILEAHKHLIRINKKNKETFQDIVDLMEKELNS
jgi:anti-anti-sigma factor